jgi:hypothetical protein
MSTRSNNFVASFQIEALCQSLRTLAANRLEPGSAARGVLRSLRDGFVKSGTGTTVQHIPDVGDECSLADLIVIAELLRVSMIAFLTPEEADEQRGYFGFRAPS